MNTKKVNETKIEEVVDKVTSSIPLEALNNTLKEVGDILPSDFSIVYNSTELGLLVTVEGTDNRLFVSYKELEIYVRDAIKIIGEVDEEYILETIEDILREDLVRWLAGTKENVFTQRV